MASKKISYNDLKKDKDNSQQAAAFSSGKSVISYNTGFEKIKVDTIRDDPKGDFVEIFSFNEKAAQEIADSMIAKGYDKTQVIHLCKIMEEPDTMEKPIRLDGAHRVAAARIAGIEEIPSYIHTFETRKDALIYAYELQLLRRNLEPYQKLDALSKLDQLKNPGRKTDENTQTGKSAEELGELIGVSTRTAERMRNIINNGDEETLNAVKSGKLSISAADKKTNEKKHPKKAVEDDISDALEDNSENPQPVFIHERKEQSSDRLSLEVDSERTQERKAAYEQGLKKGSDLAYEIYDYILSAIESGKTTDDIRKDSKFTDFSVPLIYKAFDLED